MMRSALYWDINNFKYYFLLKFIILCGPSAGQTFIFCFDHSSLQACASRLDNDHETSGTTNNHSNLFMLYKPSQILYQMEH